MKALANISIAQGEQNGYFDPKHCKDRISARLVYYFYDGGSGGGRPKTVSNEPEMKLLADKDTARVSAPTFTPYQTPGPSV